jgi:hypothetical protein
MAKLPHLARLVYAFACAVFLFLAAVIHAQSATNAAAQIRGLTPEELKELAELDPALAREFRALTISKWNFGASLTTGGGYKDNIMLGHLQPQASGFSRFGGEFTAWRMPANGWQFFAYLYGDDIRYLNSDEMRKEQIFTALSQLKKTLEAWELSLSAQYLYLDQVMDLSDAVDILQPMLVQGHSFSPKLGVRHPFGRTNWWEVEMNLTRQWFAQPLDDYWEGGPRLTLGHHYGSKSEVRLSYGFNLRSHDTRTQVDRDGLAMPGALVYRQHKLALYWRHYLNDQRRWQIVTRVGVDRSEDNGSGYYNYWKYQLGEQVRYLSGRWEGSATIRYARYEYSVQSPTFSTSDLLRRDEWCLGTRLEFKVCKEMKLYAEYEHERNFSNQVFSQYRVNTFNGGILWEF